MISQKCFHMVVRSSCVNWCVTQLLQRWWVSRAPDQHEAMIMNPESLRDVFVYKIRLSLPRY